MIFTNIALSMEVRIPRSAISGASGLHLPAIERLFYDSTTLILYLERGDKRFGGESVDNTCRVNMTCLQPL
jgi:hypothetical protein